MIARDNFQMLVVMKEDGSSIAEEIYRMLVVMKKGVNKIQD